MYVKWRANRQTQRNHRERVQVRGGETQIYGWSMAPWWGKEHIESDRDKWGVSDREKEIQTYACWPQPFFSQLINTGKWALCVFGCVCVCVCACLEGGSVCVAPNNDQKHSDITSALSDSSLTVQPLHMPLFNSGPCNLIRDWEVRSTQTVLVSELGEESGI